MVFIFVCLLVLTQDVEQREPELDWLNIVSKYEHLVDNTDWLCRCESILPTLFSAMGFIESTRCDGKGFESQENLGKVPWKCLNMLEFYSYKICKNLQNT